MRDADDEEKTRLFDANQSGRSAALAQEAPPLPSAAKRAPAAPVTPLADPDDEATKLIDSAVDDEATKLIDSAVDDEATKLVDAIGSGEWLLSRGTNPPRSVSRAVLFKEIAEGTLSPETYAWKDGMKDWQPLRQIPTLAPLLRGRPSPKVPRAPIGLTKKEALGPLIPKTPEPKTPFPKRSPPATTPLGTASARGSDSPQSRITAVSRQSATSRAHSTTSDTSPAHGAASEHTVTSSSARASREAKDSTVLVSGSVPPNDSVESSAPLLPPSEPPDPPPLPQRHSSGPPRPAAGQPPSPTELIAKPPAPATSPRPHREVTQPARSRLTAVTQLTQLASVAGRQQNLVLWVLGAAGWVVAGVLAGILFAKSEAPPAPQPEPARERVVIPQPAVPPPREHSEPEKPPALEAESLPDQSAATLPPAAKLQPIPRLLPAASTPPAAATAAPVATPTVPVPAAPAAPARGDQINSPGF